MHFEAERSSKMKPFQKHAYTNALIFAASQAKKTKIKDSWRRRRNFLKYRTGSWIGEKPPKIVRYATFLIPIPCRNFWGDCPPPALRAKGGGGKLFAHTRSAPLGGQKAL